MQKTVSLDFTTNPKALAVVNDTSAFICGSSDLYLIDFSEADPSFQTLNRDLIDSPQDVEIFGNYIYLLNNKQGDILYMPFSGGTAYSVPLSAMGSAPTDASSLAVTGDGTLYIADTTGNKLFCYNLSFGLDQKIITSDYGFSGPSCLYASGEDLYVGFGVESNFALLTHPVATGDYYITLDDVKISDFDKAVSTYAEKRDADTEYVDIDCVTSSGYTVDGNIGRYLLFYGLNTFDVTVSDGETEQDYTLYVTRSYPDWFTTDDLDDYYVYVQSKSEEEESETNKKNSGEQTLLLDISNINIDGLTITSFSKKVETSVEGTQVRIILTGNDEDDPPVIQLASDEALVMLSAAELERMVAKMRNQYLLYAVFAGTAVLLLVYFFLDYLKKHPGRRNYKRIKK